MNRQLENIRQRAEDRRATGLAGGVREWFDLDYLLRILDTKLCKRCKAKVEADE